MIHLIWTFLSSNATAILAVATALIAIFNLVFIFVTGKQISKLAESIEISRAEFIATHRPEIIIRSVEVPSSPKEGIDGSLQLSAVVTYVNNGIACATVTEIKKEIRYTYLPVSRGPTSDPTKVERKLVGGESDSFIVNSSRDITVEKAWRTDAFRRGGAPDSGTYICIGEISYRDDMGIRRQTGFCRRFDSDGECWVDANSPQYEYS